MTGGCVPHYELQVSTKAYEIEGHALAVKHQGWLTVENVIPM